MPTFPTFTRSYSTEGYTYEVGHEVVRTQFHTGNSRQRKLFENHDDRFSASLILSDSELETFESFVKTDLDYGASTYTGPYFTSDAEYTGTIEMVDGAYTADLVPPESWKVSFNFIVKDRDMTEENTIYDTVISLGSISNTYNVISALEDMVNNNTL
jgi:hypothetical protein